MTTIIFEVSCERMAWLIPHLIVKNSALEEVTLITWWRVLTTGLLKTWICAIEEATLFLTLASVITRVSDREEKDSMAKTSSC